MKENEKDTIESSNVTRVRSEPVQGGVRLYSPPEPRRVASDLYKKSIIASAFSSNANSLNDPVPLASSLTMPAGNPYGPIVEGINLLQKNDATISRELSLEDALNKLQPYFIPKSGNWGRFTGLCCGVALIPAASLLPFLVLTQKQEKNESYTVSVIVATLIAVSINLFQEALNTFLSLSTSMAIYKDNVTKLMHKPHFLMHGITQDISSLQNVTTGRAVGDFAYNSIPVLIGTPVSVASAITTLAYIYFKTKDRSVGAVIAFIASSAGIIYLIGEKYAEYIERNLEVANKLVNKVNFLESNKNSIIAIKALSKEYQDGLDQVKLMDNSVCKLTTIHSLYSFITLCTPIISNNFFGGFFVNNSLDAPTITTLNIIVTSLIVTVQKITLSRSAQYPYIKVNLKELLSFDQAYQQCLENCKKFKGVQISFDNKLPCFNNELDIVSLKNLSVFVLDKEQNIKTVIKDLQLDLNPGKLYKLSANSGTGKSLFLNALVQNWYYAEGEVHFPYPEDKIYFIPKDSFIPQKTLLEVLTYPLKIEEYLSKNSAFVKYSKEELIKDIQIFFKECNLWDLEDPESKVQLKDLEETNIDWSQRLSGGERQKIGIVRALLTHPAFIIMDEATNAIDYNSKLKIFNFIKSILSELSSWYLIYTEHDKNTDIFADCILHMKEQSIEVKEALDLELGSDIQAVGGCSLLESLN